MFWGDRLARLAETSSFRHAAMMAYVFLLMAVGSMLLSNHQTEKLLQDHVRDMVLMEVQLHAESLKRSDLPSLKHSLQLISQHNHDSTHALLLDSRGQVLFGEPYLKRVRDCYRNCERRWVETSVQDDEGKSHRFVGMQVPLAQGGYYLTAYDILPMQERLRVIPLVAGAGLFVVLLSSLCLGLYSSMRSMRRVDHLRQRLHRYVSGDRQARLPVSEHGDEFDLLGKDVNRMLSQINFLMGELKDISAHLAHELRTPLTRLHNQLISAVETLKDGPEKEHILNAMDEAERVQRMFRAILRIGEIESERCSHAFEWFDAERLLQELTAYYQPMAEVCRMPLKIDMPQDWQLYGDRALLFQALANLLENAFKYGTPDTSIILLLQGVEAGVDLGIADHGKGIPPGLRQDAVKRFHRLPQGDKKPGSGLGLALVSAIAKLHGGHLLLRDNDPVGLRATLRLPVQASSARTQLVDVLKQ